MKIGTIDIHTHTNKNSKKNTIALKEIYIYILDKKKSVLKESILEIVQFSEI